MKSVICAMYIFVRAEYAKSIVAPSRVRGRRWVPCAIARAADRPPAVRTGGAAVPGPAGASAAWAGQADAPLGTGGAPPRARPDGRSDPYIGPSFPVKGEWV